MRILIIVASLIFLSPIYLYSQWFHQDSGTEFILYSVDFLTKEEGWIAGGDNTVKKTFDGGHNWFKYSRYTTPADRYIWYGICFNNMDDIYVCGSVFNYDRYQSNWIYSKNGGTNWTAQSSWGSARGQWNDVFFLDEINGWRVGYSSNTGLCYKTSGGAVGEWEDVYTAEGRLYAVFFVDENNGWIGGNNGLIYNSTDGGENWESQNSGTQKSIRSVYFIDAFNGWSVGFDNDGAVILRTTNGGQSWTATLPPDILQLHSIYFKDANIGWSCGSIVHEQEERGAILYTENGGETWEIQHIEDTLSILYDIDFIDDYTGWVVGTNGTILKTTNGGVTGIDGENHFMNHGYSLYQNYPNPFNSSAIILYDIPERSFVRLTVYNILGEIVTQLINKELEAGTHEVTFDASHLTSGVYIYRLQAGEYVESKKLLFLK